MSEWFDRKYGRGKGQSAREAIDEKNKKRSDQQYEQYMGEVGSYLDKVRKGRSVRRVDPSQAAFDEESERTRQLKQHEKTGAYERLIEREYGR